MKLGGKIKRWFREWPMSIKGVLLATRTRQFWQGFIPSFIIFGILMQMFSGSTASLGLFWATDWSGRWRIISSSFLAIFGANRSFIDWLLLFVITILQSILIGLIVTLWRKKKQNSENIQSVGIVTGLALLGSGCPTCGTTMLAPVLAAVVSSGSLAIAGVLSVALTALSIIVSIFVLQRLGKDVYARVKYAEYEAKVQKMNFTSVVNNQSGQSKNKAKLTAKNESKGSDNSRARKEKNK